MAEFGRDISCTASIRPGQFSSGVRLVGEAVYRRLTTPRGTLRGGEEEQDYGLDLSELVGSVSSVDDALAIQGRIENEILKDERIEEATAIATIVDKRPGISLDVVIEAETGEGPFSLNLRVSEVTVELLKLDV